MKDVEIKKQIKESMDEIRSNIKAIFLDLGLEVCFYSHKPEPVVYLRDDWRNAHPSKKYVQLLHEKIDILVDELGYEFEEVKAHLALKKKEK